MPIKIDNVNIQGLPTVSDDTQSSDVKGLVHDKSVRTSNKVAKGYNHGNQVVDKPLLSRSSKTQADVFSSFLTDTKDSLDKLVKVHNTFAETIKEDESVTQKDTERLIKKINSEKNKYVDSVKNSFEKAKLVHGVMTKGKGFRHNAKDLMNKIRGKKSIDQQKRGELLHQTNKEMKRVSDAFQKMMKDLADKYPEIDLEALLEAEKGSATSSEGTVTFNVSVNGKSKQFDVPDKHKVAFVQAAKDGDKGLIAHLTSQILRESGDSENIKAADATDIQLAEQRAQAEKMDPNLF